MRERSFVLYAKVAIIVFAIALAVFTYSTNSAEARSTGPENSYTGAPGEGSCVFCHSQFPINSGSGSLRILGVPDNYTPNQEIPITVTIKHSDATIYGFQLTALDANNNFVGTLIPTNTVETGLFVPGGGGGLGRTYIQHKFEGTNPSPVGQRSWSFTWKAPATRVGKIKFYAASVAGNSTSSPDGDYVYTISTTTGDAVADFDGDGKTDLSIYRPSVGQWWYQRSSDNQVPAFTFGISSDKLTPGDYDGDGKTDAAFWRPSTGEWFVLRSSNLTFFAAPFGANGDTPAPGDFDGDGITDFTVFRSGTWFTLKSTGGVTITPFGTSGDIPQVSDYDADGKSDVCIYRPTGANGQSEWWMTRSSNGSLFATPFGSSTDKPVPGDYTGDGKSDFAFFRPSSATWFVLRSEDLSFFAAPFGANGDVAAPGDYDGDGKTDFGVFRPTGATWFVQKSGGGTLIQNFGATGDIPVPAAFIP